MDPDPVGSAFSWVCIANLDPDVLLEYFIILYVISAASIKMRVGTFFWFRFFLEDDTKLESIREEYSSGRLLSGFLKKELVDILTPLILKHQATPFYYIAIGV